MLPGLRLSERASLYASRVYSPKVPSGKPAARAETATLAQSMQILAQLDDLPATLNRISGSGVPRRRCLPRQVRLAHREQKDTSGPQLCASACCLVFGQSSNGSKFWQLISNLAPFKLDRGLFPVSSSLVPAPASLFAQLPILLSCQRHHGKRVSAGFYSAVQGRA